MREKIQGWVFAMNWRKRQSTRFSDCEGHIQIAVLGPAGTGWFQLQEPPGLALDQQHSTCRAVLQTKPLRDPVGITSHNLLMQSTLHGFPCAYCLLAKCFPGSLHGSFCDSLYQENQTSYTKHFVEGIPLLNNPIFWKNVWICSVGLSRDEKIQLLHDRISLKIF